VLRLFLQFILVGQTPTILKIALDYYHFPGKTCVQCAAEQEM